MAHPKKPASADSPPAPINPKTNNPFSLKGKARPPMPGAGRPRAEIDWSVVAELCHMQCTIPEISGFCRVDAHTLYDRCLKDNGIEFPKFMAQNAEGGKSSLRRTQWKVACEAENPALLIWAGKQYLSQADKIDSNNNNNTTITLSDTETAAKILSLIETLTQRAAKDPAK